MCGIAGIAQRVPDERLRRAFVTAARFYLGRRGPDDFGVLGCEPALTLVHTRLSIIDVVGGGQPMSDAQGALTYNGEIYNFRELRDSALLYRTRSDTEVLLQGLNRAGVDFLPAIEGMFAFGYYDRWRRRLSIARDRFGIKPVYYFSDGNTFAFCSRMQPLMLLSNKAVDHRALVEYYGFRACASPRTLFSDVHELSPGSSLCIDLATLTVSEPARWVETNRPPRDVKDEAVGTEMVDTALRRAVQLHLASDVPVGSLLSGGVDSGLVTKLAAESDRSVAAFSLGFADERYDESGYASAICRRLQIRHLVHYCDQAEFVAEVDRWPEVMDDAVADPSAVMLRVIASFARDAGYRVLLSGDGADELFAGYNQYARSKAAGAASVAGRWLPVAADIVEAMLPAKSRHVQLARSVTTGRQFYGAGRIFEPYLLQRLVSGAESPAGEVRSLSDILAGDVARRLPDDVLTRTDRAAMDVSVEVRVPFVSQTVADAAFRMKEPLLLRGLRPKYLLKRVAERHLPRECIYRRKRGFDLPLARWFRGSLRERLGDAFAGTWQSAHLDTGLMARVIDDHMAGRNDNADKLWAFLLLENNVRHLRAITLTGVEGMPGPSFAALGEISLQPPEMARSLA
ncbi:MAG: asparagine synthase (glutamine-hydrolyzing) [Acetobacteraceae bacterium]|nr:asparagine synthase (glutamine-hydrolyzing) [Acetobacteraceae bacterium]